MFRIRTWMCALLLPLTPMVIAGCQKDAVDRYPISGSVSIGGQPIRAGFVTFEPTSNLGGRQGYAKIRDGRFDTRDDGEPAIAGSVVVRIQGWGEPTERFPNGVPVCHNYEIAMNLGAEPSELELKVPESARVKEPKGGWGEAP